MRSHKGYLLVVAFLPMMALAACQTGSSTQAPCDTTGVQTLSDVPLEQPLNAPAIDLRMQTFNANIGDTATGVGGGGAHD